MFQLHAVPTGPDDEKCARATDVIQILGLGIAAVRDYKIGGSEGEASQSLGARGIGQFDVIDLPSAQVHAHVQPPVDSGAARSGYGGRVNQAQTKLAARQLATSGALGKLLREQLSEPRTTPTKTFKKGHVRNRREADGLRICGRLAQRKAAEAVGDR